MSIAVLSLCLVMLQVDFSGESETVLPGMLRKLEACHLTCCSYVRKPLYDEFGKVCKVTT